MRASWRVLRRQETHIACAIDPQNMSGQLPATEETDPDFGNPLRSAICYTQAAPRSPLHCAFLCVVLRRTAAGEAVPEREQALEGACVRVGG